MSWTHFLAKIRFFSQNLEVMYFLYRQLYTNFIHEAYTWLMALYHEFMIQTTSSVDIFAAPVQLWEFTSVFRSDATRKQEFPIENIYDARGYDWDFSISFHLHGSIT